VRSGAQSWTYSLEYLYKHFGEVNESGSPNLGTSQHTTPSAGEISGSVVTTDNPGGEHGSNQTPYEFSNSIANGLNAHFVGVTGEPTTPG